MKIKWNSNETIIKKPNKLKWNRGRLLYIINLKLNENKSKQNKMKWIERS